MNSPSRPLIAEALETAVDILRLRKGPEDMPASTTLLWIFLVAGVLLQLSGMALPVEQEWGSMPVLIALDLVVTLIGVRFALNMAGHPARFTQTMTALFACQAVILPALLATQWMRIVFDASPGMGALARVLNAAVGIWILVVTARILRSATGWSLFAAFALILGMELVTGAIYLMIYPLPPEAFTLPN